MARSSATWTYSTCPRGLAPAVSFWAQLNVWVVRLTVSDQRSYIVQQERMKETSANDLPWHLGQENLFLWNFAVQEKQHPDPWCLHINNASASIRMNKVTSPRVLNTEDHFIFSCQCCIQRGHRVPGRWRGLPEIIMQIISGKSEYFLISLDSKHPPTTIHLWIWNQFTD